eukprot:gene1127-1432_t
MKIIVVNILLFNLLFLIFNPNIFVLSGESSSSSSSSCRAVTFSGAGDRGAYEAGVIWGLVDAYNDQPHEIEWQFITGISAGSINAASMSMFNIGQEEQAKDFIIQKWLSITKEDVYKDWKGGVIEGLLLKNGIFDTSPLRNYLNTNLNVEQLINSNRVLNIGSTCISTGDFQIFNKTTPDIITAVMASSAIPGLFPSIEMGGQTYVDGGVSYMAIVTDTTRLCVETGATDIVIDVILGVGEEDRVENATDFKTLSVLARSFSIVQNNFYIKDIETARLTFPQAQFRVFTPSQKLPGDFINFKHSEEMINIGFKDATNEIAKIKKNSRINFANH